MTFNVHPKTKTLVLAAAGVLVGIVLATLLRWAFSASSTASVTTVASPTVAEVVGRHLDWADRQSAEGLAPQFGPIHEFFAQASFGVRPFAEDALGWTSKWKLIEGYFAGGDAHRQYLEERFAARIFASDDLESLVQQVVAAYLNHLDNVDAMLLVNLQADLEGIPAGSFTAGVGRADIEQALNAAICDAVQAVEADFPGMIGRELASFVAGEVLSMATVELATSAGILGAGASSGTVTFGIGLLAGLIVDAIITEIYDPAGELSLQLDETLLRLEEIIVSGNGEQPGLYHRLLDYASRRGQARKAAITSVVLPPGELSPDSTF